jgi:enoyl-CoA hydratase
VTADGGAAATWDFLTVRTADTIAIVSLDRAPVNAVNQAMYSEIRDLFSRFDELLPGVKAVVLTGSGRHFCAGNDSMSSSASTR